MAGTPARKAAPLDRGALLPVRDGLSAGGRWIRTSGSACDASAAQGENSRVRLRPPPSIICGCRRWPSAKAQSEISEPNRYRARNRKFESVSLQRRVFCEPDFLPIIG